VQQNKITDLPEEVRAAYPGTAANSIVGHSQFEVFGTNRWFVSKSS
jgi:N-acetyl-anhydromuramyl-L-alanine amidase AmpD